MITPEYTCNFAIVTPTPQPWSTTTMTELSPNPDMSLAQQDVPSMAVTTLAQRLAQTSLDMNPSAEDAYEQAVMTYATQNGSGSTLTISGSVSSDNHQDFLRLLARFHQAVAPLPKSITKSFTRATTPPRAEGPKTYASISSDHAMEDQERTSSSVSSFSGRSRLAYVPSRGYSKPANAPSPARRRTSSAPSPAASLIKKISVAPAFKDMESLIKTADEMMHFMRNDMEEVMKRSRRRDRETREAGNAMDVDKKTPDQAGKFVDIEDDAPLVRKVPVRQGMHSRFSTSLNDQSCF